MVNMETVEVEGLMSSLRPQLFLSAPVLSGFSLFQHCSESDPTGEFGESKSLFEIWTGLFLTADGPAEETQAYVTLIKRLKTAGILCSDQGLTLFLTAAAESCVQKACKQIKNSKREESYYAPDAFVRLLSLLVRDVGDGDRKMYIMEKSLGIVAKALQEDMEKKGEEFQSLPYHRIIISLFNDMIDPVFENNGKQSLIAFCAALHNIRPSEAPGFAFAWWDIVGNRRFLSGMLAVPDWERWWMYFQLLMDFIKFLAPFLKNVRLGPGLETAYKGLLRVLLVILHDFQDFLSYFAPRFMDVIPPNAVQLKNVILGASPEGTSLPFPYTGNQFAQLELAHLTPVLCFDPESMIPPHFKEEIDDYLESSVPGNFLLELKYNFDLYDVDELGNRYNIPLLNAVILYVATAGIRYFQGWGEPLNFENVVDSPYMGVFATLAEDFDSEGRYLFFTALANHLRYPSTHTRFFGLVILFIFLETKEFGVKEILTRTLLDRMAAYRPWPWGLLVIFHELTVDKDCHFGDEPFLNVDPELNHMIKFVQTQLNDQSSRLPFPTPTPNQLRPEEQDAEIQPNPAEVPRMAPIGTGRPQTDTNTPQAPLPQ